MNLPPGFQYPKAGEKIALLTPHGHRIVTVYAIHPNPAAVEHFHTLVVDDPFMPGVKVYASPEDIDPEGITGDA